MVNRKDRKEEKGRLNLILSYTLVFFIMFFLCCGQYFLHYHKAPFWSIDTVAHDFPGFRAVSKIIRAFIGNIIKNHSIDFPFWNPAIGYGADNLITFIANFFDPFNWIAVFFTGESLEIGYWIMILLKYYLMGLSFVLFTHHRKCSLSACLGGAVIYLFSMTAYIGFYHNSFINPMIILPMLIMGADKLFEENRSAQYVFFLTCTFCTFVQLAYMLSVFVLLYCVLKFFFLPKEQKTWRKAFCLFTRFFFFSLLCAGITAIMLIPVAINLLGMDRLGLQQYLPLFYEKVVNEEIVTGWVTGVNMLSRDSFLGFGAFAFTCIAALFVIPKKYLQQKIEVVLLTTGLFIPFFGHIMNAMSYPANRWVFAYSFLIGYIVSLVQSDMKYFSLKQGIIVILISAAYICLIRLGFRRTSVVFETISILLIFFAVVCILARNFSERAFHYLTFCLCCVSAFLFSYCFFSKNVYNTLVSFVDSGTVYPMSVNEGGLPMIGKIQKSDSERFDRSGITIVPNASWFSQLGCYDFYHNMYNNDIDRFHNDMALLTSPWNFGYRGLNFRTELEMLMGTNHFLADPGELKKPYGYDLLEYTAPIGIQSYSMEQDQSMFHLFDRSVSYEDYLKLKPLDRQQALMQAVVIENGNTQLSQLELSDDEIGFEITETTGLDFDGKTAAVSGGVGSISLSFDPVTDSEIYVYIEGIYYQQYAAFSQVAQADFVVDARAYNNGQLLPKLTASFQGNNYYSHMYGGKHNWLMNLGYTSEKTDNVTIWLNGTGVFKIGDIKVYARPAKELDSSIARLSQNDLIFTFADDQYDGFFITDSPQYLLASVPFSRGWEAYDNGQSVDILKADTGFMAIALDSGEHHVSFHYHTPGLLPGAIISGVSLVVYTCFLIIRKRREEQDHLLPGNAI